MMTNRNFFPYLAFTLVLLVLVSGINAQKIALLDTKLKTPIVYTEILSAGQVSFNVLAVPVKDFDTIYSNFVYLKEMLSKKQLSKMESFQLLTNSTQIKVARFPMVYGDRYLVSLISKIGNVTSRMTLSNGEISNKDLTKKLGKLITYLTSNNSAFSPSKGIKPKMHNIVLISGR